MSKELTILEGPGQPRTGPRPAHRPAPARAEESDAEYFSRRAEQEEAVALSNSDPALRSIHLDLAERYRQLAGAITDAKGPWLA